MITVDREDRYTMIKELYYICTLPGEVPSPQDMIEETYLDGEEVCDDLRRTMVRDEDVYLLPEEFYT